MYESKIITDIKELHNTHCLISQKKLESAFNNGSTIIKLSCGHCFLYFEFMKSFIINNRNIYSYYKCPYCSSVIDKPPILIGKCNI